MSQYREGSEPVPGYKLAEFLGKGSYGEVWKANGPGGTEIAIKFIALDSQQGLKEFRAIGLVKKLRHPNLVPIHAYWLRDPHGNVIGDAPTGGSLETESARFRLGGRKELVIAMGLGDTSLAQKLEDSRETGGISPRALLRYMEGAARGIDFLNDPIHPPNNSPIIHCDIKPGNLLVVGGEVQVCDYGVAQLLGADVKKTLGAGTPAYAPPELINNDPHPRTDQYSLAIAYYELRTGRLPFDEMHALRANMTGELDLSLLERDERAVIRKATSLQPERRFATVQDMVDELRVACNVSQTTSGVQARPGERKLPVNSPTPKRLPTEPPSKDTVTFPENTRPTPAAQPKPESKTEPWADSSQMMPALPKELAKPAPAEAGRKWLWPLVIGLLIGVGGITAYVVSRPKADGKAENTTPVEKPKDDPKPIDPKPPEKKDVKPPVTAAAVLKILDPLVTFAAPTDFPLVAKLIDDEQKLADLSTTELGVFKVEVSKLLAKKLADGEKSFAWVDALTVPDLLTRTAAELDAAQKWFAAAADFAAKRTEPSARYSESAAFAAAAHKVATGAKPADRVGFYDRARAEQSLSPARRTSFLLKPLSSDTFEMTQDDRKPAAAAVLVWGAEVLASPTVVPMLTRAYDFASKVTVAAVDARRKKLPCDEFGAELGKRGSSAYDAAFKTYSTDLSKATAAGEQAIVLYEDALAVAPLHAARPVWYMQLSKLVALFRGVSPVNATPARVKQYAVSVAHLQTAYLIVAERVEAGTSKTADDRDILNDSIQMKERNRYSGLGGLFADQKTGNTDFWKAISAECTFMQSDMAKADRDALQKARKDIPDDATDDDLVACRKRMDGLLKLGKSRGELLKMAGG